MAGIITAAVIGVAGTAIIANQQSQAAKGAANAQTAAAQAGIAENRSQWDAIQKMLAPYVQAGTGAMGAQQALLGMGGPEAQQKAIAEIQNSPQFQVLSQQGENAILSKASATGGLRGGNVQAALGQFRPQLLSQLIEQQYGRLGQISSLGQASAAGQAAMGQQQGMNVSNLMNQMGQAQAGGYLGQGAANAGMVNGISQFGGALAGMDWSSFGGGAPSTTVQTNLPVTTMTPLSTGQTIPTQVTPF
jgi:hypothetical protein